MNECVTIGFGFTSGLDGEVVRALNSMAELSSAKPKSNADPLRTQVKTALSCEKAFTVSQTASLTYQPTRHDCLHLE